ncbi:ATP-binding protein [Hymenobacter sp. GOD-10R]|uniref:ATP-binding protein n=1 Tax=Hymenobacter sp. GOD-10R TaxID=3093922 RepID=UPI002D780AC7|nr:ATP-binding protein [Hymenobacter sp. GOD-10R]WRQ28519.1 ATP-binding protein [Hymenobacter sp. GOD-10R]
MLQTQTKLDTMRVRRLQKLGQVLTATDPAQARASIKQALTLSQDLHYTRGEGRALLWLGTIARREADYEQARRHVREAQQVFAHIRNWRGQGESCLELMLIEMMQGNNASAIVAAQQGIPLAEQANDAQTKRRLQATLGSIYLNLEDYKAALPILQAALKNGEQAGDKQVMMVMQNALGTLYTKQKNWAPALHYFERAQQLAIGEHDDVNRTIDEINMADVYRLQGNYQQARFHGLRAYARAVAGKDNYSLPFAELLLAQVYQAVHQPDSAIALASKSLERARQTRSKENMRDVSLVLAQAYAERREFAPAYRYQGQYLAYNDTLAGEQTQRQTTALRYGYELDKKQAQIALLTKTRQLQDQQSVRQRQQLYGLLAGLGSVVLVAGLLWRNVLLKQRANRRLNEKNEQIAGQRDALDRTLVELKGAQAQLIQKEKMASLGELTAGIAHEIQNPLNFVNNFAEVSAELLAELEEAQQQPERDIELEQDLYTDIRENLHKINHHGRRADAIVRGMLAHSNHGSGAKQPTKLNVLTDEYLRLAYQGVRSKDKSFVCDLQTDFAEKLDKVSVVPQDIGRVLVNLFSNAFYATQQRSQQEGTTYKPQVSVQTRQDADHIEIRVRDNGTGIPEPVRQKIFQPFFTTKPTGQGTGLGLSLSYDIVTQGHGGQLLVESELGRYTEFVVQLPA